VVEAGEALKKRILSVLRSKNAGASFDEIRSLVDYVDVRRLRLVLAELVREGVVERVADYERRRMVFRAVVEAARSSR